MPFFGNKFSPKKTPSRKKNISSSRETAGDLVTDQKTINLKLGDQEFVFENGEWTPDDTIQNYLNKVDELNLSEENGATSATHKTNTKLRKKIQDLQEQNNLLQLKYEMILNMLTQVTSENHIQQREIDMMNKGRRNKTKS